MSRRDLEEIHLSEANTHIHRGEVVVKQQEELVRRLELTGQDTTAALKLLFIFNGILKTMYEHRTLILHELDEYNKT